MTGHQELLQKIRREKDRTDKKRYLRILDAAENAVLFSVQTQRRAEEKAAHSIMFRQEARRTVENAVHITRIQRQKNKDLLSQSRRVLAISFMLTGDQQVILAEPVSRCANAIKEIEDFLSQTEEGRVLAEKYRNSIAECERAMIQHMEEEKTSVKDTGQSCPA